MFQQWISWGKSNFMACKAFTAGAWVSFRNRTAGRMDSKTFECDKGPLFARFVVIFPNINIFWSFKKHLWKKERSWSLAERFFKQNYCHACQVCRILSSLVHWWRQRMWGQQILNGARVATEVVSLALSNYLAFVTSWHKKVDPFAQTNR